MKQHTLPPLGPSILVSLLFCYMRSPKSQYKSKPSQSQDIAELAPNGNPLKSVSSMGGDHPGADPWDAGGVHNMAGDGLQNSWLVRGWSIPGRNLPRRMVTLEKRLPVLHANKCAAGSRKFSCSGDPWSQHGQSGQAVVCCASCTAPPCSCKIRAQLRQLRRPMWLTWVSFRVPRCCYISFSLSSKCFCESGHDLSQSPTCIRLYKCLAHTSNVPGFAGEVVLLVLR